MNKLSSIFGDQHKPVDSISSLSFDSSLLSEKNVAGLCALALNKNATLKGIVNIVFTGNDTVQFKGTFIQALNSQDVEVECVLFDDSVTGERECLIKFILPVKTTRADFFNRYRKGLETEVSIWDNGSSVDYYIPGAAPADNNIIFSTLNLKGRQISYYPASFVPVIPAAEIGEGLNCSLSLATAGVYESLAAFFEEDVKDDQSKHPWMGLVYLDQTNHRLAASHRFSFSKSIGPVKLELDSFEIDCSIGKDDELYCRNSFSGKLVAGHTSLLVDLTLSREERMLVAVIRQLPTLEDALKYCGVDVTGLPFPLDELLGIGLSEFVIAISLTGMSVSQLRLTLNSNKEIELLDKTLGLAPYLVLIVNNPFDTDIRTMEGQITGVWTIGQASFETSLTYPGLVVSAALTKGTLHTADLAKKMFQGVELPDIDIYMMGLQADLAAKTYSGKVGITDDAWQITIGSMRLAFKDLELGLIYNGDAGEYYIAGKLSLGEAVFLLSAAYDSVSGWQFSCRQDKQQINIGGLIAALGKLFGLDIQVLSAIAKLNIVNCNLSFSTRSKEVSFSAAIESDAYFKNDNHIPEDFDLKNLQLSIKTGAATNCQLSAGLLIPFGKGNTTHNVEFNLSAEYTDGWQMTAAMDGAISLAELLEKFTASKDIPPALSDFSFGNITVSFNTKSADKRLSGMGKFKLPDTTNATEVDLFLKIDITHDKDGKTATDFSGHLLILPDTSKKNEQFVFDIIFDKDPKSEAFIACYHDETNKAITLAGLLKGFGIASASGLNLAVKDVCFIMKGNKSILYSDINAALNLSGLPLIGKIFPPGKSVSLALKLVYSSDSFIVSEIDNINKLLPQGTEKIGFTKPGDPTAQPLPAGLRFSTRLTAGDTVLTLDLPVTDKEIENSHKKAQDGILNPQSAAATPVSTDQVEGIKWISINKSIAVIHFNRIGIAYKDSRFFIFPDASVDVGGLSLALDGLGLSAKLDPFNLDYYLRGLSLDFSNGPVEIGAAFLRRTVNGVDEFSGMAVIKTAELSITAMGAYSRDNEGHNSLFIFAYLNQALGGPAFFFVEGLAAAFGYNRSILMPEVEDVTSFPLVRQVMQPQQSGAQQDKAAFLKMQLDSLAKYLPASPGNMFLAVGVKFNSFKLIDSFVLLAISFGNHFEIDVLGQSNIIVPAEIETGQPPLAQITIGLVAKFNPEEGTLAVRAQLAKDSHILSTECRLTGGAAFYCWFKGDHKGDFVVTMGGYNPSFNIPPHYPQVPRLELNWQVCPELSVKGDMYFALCSHAFMAGGHLQALFSDGPLSAWFNAGADFLISWQPYHYEAEIYVDMGASYTYHLFGTHHITVDIGADVHIWGPEFAGSATIDLWITSVTVKFGPQNRIAKAPVKWDDFVQKCLPEKNKICTIAISRGQHGEKTGAGIKTQMVNPAELTITIDSVIPLNGIVYHDQNVLEDGKDIHYPAFGIAPMDKQVGPTDLSAISTQDLSTHAITITRDGSENIPAGKLIFKAIDKTMPAATWGTRFEHALNDPEKNIRVISGLTIMAKPTVPGKRVLFDPDQGKDEVLTYQWENYPGLVYNEKPGLDKFFE